MDEFYITMNMKREAKKHMEIAPSHDTQNMGITEWLVVVANLPCWWECVGTILMKRRGTTSNKPLTSGGPSLAATQTVALLSCRMRHLSCNSL